jgi:hypothetical protein
MTPRPVRNDLPAVILLGAIHTWAVAHAPRLRRVAPVHAAEGDVVMLEGDGLDGEDLLAHFGELTTWAVALSPREALAVVPQGAAPGPVTVSRRGLRSNSLAFGGPSDDVPGCFVRVDPADGASGVFRDTPVVARLSHPGDPGSLSEQTFHVIDGCGPIPARLRLSPDRMVVIWQAERLLEPGVPHFVISSGLQDSRGRPVLPHLSRFLPCSLARQDLPD